ncbi:uncharacterized protein LOC128850838 isoform X1 [Cuculus canorus]|uniref:uncharacterized protein LOC128850838 isoform X1 n=1 Tax=Cuculus canorus TaxID=55661 RepID=UPI0023AB5268|nr:uncharacterized protein LOC128850838 isoform X1 [Cuculus canorus]
METAPPPTPSGTPWPPRDARLAAAEVGVLAVILTLALGGNVLVLLALRPRRGHAPPRPAPPLRRYLRHLSMADLGVAGGQVLPQLLWDVTDRFQGPDVLCRVTKYLQGVAMFAPAYVAVAMAYNRHRAICRPLGGRRGGGHRDGLCWGSWGWRRRGSVDGEQGHDNNMERVQSHGDTKHGAQGPTGCWGRRCGDIRGGTWGHIGCWGQSSEDTGNGACGCEDTRDGAQGPVGCWERECDNIRDSKDGAWGCGDIRCGAWGTIGCWGWGCGDTTDGTQGHRDAKNGAWGPSRFWGWKCGDTTDEVQGREDIRGATWRPTGCWAQGCGNTWPTRYGTQGHEDTKDGTQEPTGCWGQGHSGTMNGTQGHGDTRDGTRGCIGCWGQRSGDIWETRDAKRGPIGCWGWGGGDSRDGALGRRDTWDGVWEPTGCSGQGDSEDIITTTSPLCPPAVPSTLMSPTLYVSPISPAPHVTSLRSSTPCAIPIPPTSHVNQVSPIPHVSLSMSSDPHVTPPTSPSLSPSYQVPTRTLLLTTTEWVQATMGRSEATMRCSQAIIRWSQATMRWSWAAMGWSWAIMGWSLATMSLTQATLRWAWAIMRWVQAVMGWARVTMGWAQSVVEWTRSTVVWVQGRWGPLATAWTLAFLFGLPQVGIFGQQDVGAGEQDCWATFIQPWGARAYVTWVALAVLVAPAVLLGGVTGGSDTSIGTTGTSERTGKGKGQELSDGTSGVGGLHRVLESLLLCPVVGSLGSPGSGGRVTWVNPADPT